MTEFPIAGRSQVESPSQGPLRLCNTPGFGFRRFQNGYSIVKGRGDGLGILERVIDRLRERSPIATELSGKATET